jgi:hypothetical protein
MTAVSSSEIVIEPSMFASPTAQLVTGASVSAMLTIVSSSLIVTWPSPLQSPTHTAGCWVAVVVGVAKSATQIGFVAHPSAVTSSTVTTLLPSGSQPPQIGPVPPTARQQQSQNGAALTSNGSASAPNNRVAQSQPMPSAARRVVARGAEPAADTTAPGRSKDRLRCSEVAEGEDDCGRANDVAS